MFPSVYSYPWYLRGRGTTAKSGLYSTTDDPVPLQAFLENHLEALVHDKTAGRAVLYSVGTCANY